MKDTPQLQNAEDLMELYEKLTFLVSQLNSDTPKIKKMYTSLEQAIAKQETVAAKASQTIEIATSATVAKMQKESQTVLDAAAQYLAKAEAIAKRCETALSQVEAITKNVQSVREYQLAVDKRLAQLEAKLQTANINPQTSSVLPPKASTIKSTPNSTTATVITLSDYFKENGFKVIDYRTSGGALWVIGSEAALKPYVIYAEKHFGVTGRYGSGRATNSKPAWWTKDEA